MPVYKTYVYHLLVLTAVIVWGTTFVSTKILLANGLTPADIFFYRFLVAYLSIWLLSPRMLWTGNLKDECLSAVAGICGGSLYFLTENMALEITLASNVALIICTAPVLTAALVRLFGKERGFSRSFAVGSLLALAGVAFVVFNGRFVLKIEPWGDLLSVAAALLWACYNLAVKGLEKYPVLFVTRKVFFYGLLTILPVFLFHPLRTDAEILLCPAVWGNLLFLGLIASLICFILWNIAVKHLGAVRATNYIYLTPLVTLLASAAILDERITWIAMMGTVLILGGVYVAENGCRWPEIRFRRSQKERC